MKDKNLPDDNNSKSLEELTQEVNTIIEELEKKEDIKNSLDDYQKLIKYANLDFKTAADKVTEDVDGMMQYYIKDGQDYFLRTRSYIMDNYIGDDLRFCKKLMKKNKWAKTSII